MIEFAIANKEMLFAIDGVASLILGVSLVYLMQVVVPLSRQWPGFLRAALRAGLGILAVCALWTAVEFATGKVHFVWLGDVALIVAAAFVSMLLAVFRSTVLPRG